jgi:hypothetical protein
VGLDVAHQVEPWKVELPDELGVPLASQSIR